MYFLALRNARRFSTLHTDVLVSVARGILTVCGIICYQVYKVFFADSRSLDGISRYHSLIVFFFVIFNFSEKLLPDCPFLTLLLAYVFVSFSL